jgi:serine/threonine protein phosphatase PrpC
MHPENATLYIEKDLDRPELHPFLGGSAVVYTARSPTKGTASEDAAAFINYTPDSGVLLVADGAGGMRGGAQASSIAVFETMASLEQSVKDDQPLREAILNGIENAHREVTALAIGAATTLAVVELRPGRLRPYHVGDSEILVVGQRGKLKLRIVSHSPVGYAVHSGLIDEKEALHHIDRHYVFNMIGAPDMSIEMGTEIELSPLDTVVVASDGLFDNLGVEEIVEVVRTGPLEEVTAALVERARARMLTPGPNEPSKADDLTVVTWRLDGAVED